MSHVLPRLDSSRDSLSALGARKWLSRRTILLGAFLVVIYWMGVFNKVSLGVNTDSYLYYELGRNLVRTGAFATNVIRDYYGEVTFPQMSRECPPLYPLLAGIFDAILNCGVTASFYLNLLILLLSTALFWPLGKLLDRQHQQLLFLAVPLFCVTDLEYRYELSVGRSIPLAMLLSQVAFFIFLKIDELPRPSVKSCLLLGAGLGLSLLTRFDQMMFAIGFPLVAFVIWQAKMGYREALRAAGLTLLALVLTYAPWGVRNWIHFGSAFSNTGHWPVWAAFSVGDGAVWFPPGEVVPNLFTAPVRWFSARFASLDRNFSSLTELSGSFVILILFVSVLWTKFSRAQRLYCFLAVFQSIAIFVAVTASNFPDKRYYSPVHLDMVVIGFCVLTTLLNVQGERLSRPLYALLIGYMAIVGVRNVDPLLAYQTLFKEHRLFSRKDSPHVEVYRELWKDELRRVSSHSLVADYFDPHGLNYATGLRTIYFPKNLVGNPQRLRTWLELWKPNFLLIPPKLASALHFDAGVVDSFEKLESVLVDMSRVTLPQG